MPNLIRRLFRQRSLNSDVRRALEAGVGLYQASWRIEPEARAETIAEQLLDWCRNTAGEMRRPYGLDHMSLAITCLTGDGSEAARANLGVLRPGDLYGTGGAASSLQTALNIWADQGVFENGDALTLSAVLYSWGDLTRELFLAS